MLDKVSTYACNYRHDGVVQQYCLTMIKFVNQITLKWNMNTWTNYICTCSEWFNSLFFIIYHLPIYVWTKSILQTFNMHNKGMRKKISIVRPWYKIMMSQFFKQKIIKDDTIFYMQIILLQIPFLEFFFIRVIDFWGGRCAKFMPIDYNFKFFLK
jgi:hypothetical protein